MIYASMVFDDYTLDMNPQTGVFGFLVSEDALYIIFMEGGLVGAIVFCSYSMVIKYFSPLVLCTSFLCEPVIS